MISFIKMLLVVGFFGLLVLGILWSCASHTYKFKSPDAQTILLKGVHVVPMDSERILPAQNVLIRNGIIVSMTDTASGDISGIDQVVDAAGKYLLPGLTDMHVHINNDKDLMLFLLHGVTTVQNMWGYRSKKLKLMGFPDQLQLRENIAAGKILGPTILTSGPVLEGEPLTHPFMKKIVTPERARQEVRLQHAQGYDFIKVYDYLQPDVYEAIIETAKELQMPVKGHVPFSVGLDRVLESGQVSIDHLNGYINPDTAEFLIPEGALAEYAAKTRDSGVWNCPTMVIWQKRVSLERYDEMARHPGMKYLSWMQRVFLKKSITEMQKNIGYEGDYLKRMEELGYTIIGALHDAGAKLLVGTDTGNPFVFPGWAVHEELQYFVNAGLTPYEALRAATVNAAEYLNVLDQVGTVEPGKRADLILVDGNPLDDVANAGNISGVMVQGRWFSHADLEQMVEKL